jgi:regulatory protein
MRPPRRSRPPRPLNRQSLEELALAYVGRFATSRARLRDYLARKLRERGWEGSEPPQAEALVERFAEHGYVDDAAFALAKSRSLTGRGYGARRVHQALRVAGIDEQDGADARAIAAGEAAGAALRFAERRRIGPFAVSPLDRQARDKAIAAMLRAGHAFALAKAVVDLPPGSDPDPSELPGDPSFARD